MCVCVCVIVWRVHIMGVIEWTCNINKKRAETKVTTTINKEHTPIQSKTERTHTRMGIWHATHTSLSLFR